MPTIRKQLRLATHSSPLALKYAGKVIECLHELRPDIDVTLVRVPTPSDQINYPKPPDFGGRSLYVAEVLQALHEEIADLSVHVIEQSPSDKTHWPQGWLSVICNEDEGNAVHTFADATRIPERFWQ